LLSMMAIGFALRPYRLATPADAFATSTAPIHRAWSHSRHRSIGACSSYSRSVGANTGRLARRLHSPRNRRDGRPWQRTAKAHSAKAHSAALGGSGGQPQNRLEPRHSGSAQIQPWQHRVPATPRRVRSVTRCARIFAEGARGAFTISRHSACGRSREK
jgi:hypothetical protein